MTISKWQWGMMYGLLMLNLALVIHRWSHPIAETTYVLTPMMDLIPKGAWTEDEAHKLLGELRHQAEARDMQQAYGRLGATLSLADIMRGIQSLPPEMALNDQQRREVLPKLEQLQLRHHRLIEVQRELLRLEALLQQDVLNLRQENLHE